MSRVISYQERVVRKFAAGEDFPLARGSGTITCARRPTTIPLKSLTPEHLARLAPYGFDPDLLEEWRTGIRDGKLSLATNTVDGKLLAPGPDQIRDLPKADSPDRDELRRIGQDAIAAGEFGIVILNGGMATRFGGVVKGTVNVLDDKSFLGLKLDDVKRTQDQFGGRIHVFLMNSFATDESTREHLEEHDNFGLDADQVSHFTQFISVRLDAKGDIFETEDGEISPYGPGHGDFSFALRASGVLEKFLAQGGKHLMLANVDNLGGRVSPSILGHHIQHKAEVTCECAPKWPGDVGGSPYVVDGKLQLVEQIRYPEGFDPEIVDVFNTNTFHFDAATLNRDFDLGWYFVEKKVGDRRAVQIERLVGELSKFLKSNFVRVKRTGDHTRFLPIKTPDDLDSSREEIREIYTR